MLNKRQIGEIIAFDRSARNRREYDSRRYGTSSNRSLSFQSPHVIAAYPYGGMSEHDCYWTPTSSDPKPTRKTLRYNYIIKGRWTRDSRRREVKVVHVAVRLNRSFCPVVKEVAVYSPVTNQMKFRDMGYHQLGGWIVYWDRTDYENKAINAWICPRALGEWIDHPCKWGDGLKFPWHETVNVSALKGTRYEWCQYADGHRTGLCDWLWLYRQEPHIENLAKMGMYDFVTPFATNALKDKRVFRWVLDHADDLKKRVSIKAAIWAAKHQRTMKEANAHFELVESIRRRFSWSCRCDKPNARFDYERIGKLLSKWKVGVEEYVRYVQECSRAGLDLRNEGTLYPPTSGGRKAFVDRLERLEAENNRRERAAERQRKRLEAENNRRERAAERQRKRLDKAIAGKDKEYLAKLMSVRAPELAAFQTSLDRMKTLTGCGYKLILAKSQNELIKEGKRMHNCVGCGTYGRGLVVGDTLILTIQGAAKDERYCVEIDRRVWQIRQCYGLHNSQAPEAVRQIANRAADELRHTFAKMNKKRKAA